MASYHGMCPGERNKVCSFGKIRTHHGLENADGWRSPGLFRPGLAFLEWECPLMIKMQTGQSCGLGWRGGVLESYLGF